MEPTDNLLLVGMLDSPFVRRTAISLACLRVPFAHEAISVFSTFEKFRAINPVVKAPTLVCADGEVLMDSSLIIAFAERAHAGGRTLWPADRMELQHDMRAVSLALAACEKAVQIVYERNLRPAAAQYEPWLARVRVQLLAACTALEHEVRQRAAAFATGYGQACITAAVAWQFILSMPAAAVPAAGHPHLAALSARMEQQPEFLRYPPDGPGVPVAPPAA